MASQELLEDRISSLQLEIKSYHHEIITYIDSLYTSNSSTLMNPNNSSKDEENKSMKIDLKVDHNTMLKVLQHDVVELLTEASKNNDNNTKYHKDITECSTLIAITNKILLLSQKILLYEYNVGKLLISNCCELFQEIQEVLNDMSNTINKEYLQGKTYLLLVKQYKIINNKFFNKLKRILYECLRISNGTVIVSKCLDGILRTENKILEEKVLLIDVWNALLIINKTKEVLNDVLLLIWIHIIRPLYKENKVQYPSINRNDSLAELVLENIAREPPKGKHANESDRHDPNQYKFFGPCRMPVQQLVEIIGQVIGFFWADVISSNLQIAASLTVQNEPFAEVLTKLLLDTVAAHLPKSEAELVTYHKILERPAREFEENIRTLGFVISNSHSKVNSDEQSCEHVRGPISNYLVDLPIKFAEHRRREVLELARGIVLADYHNTMLATGDALEDDLSSAGDIGDPKALLEQSGTFALQLLKFDSCQISLAICRLLKLVNETMKQACSASTKVANILYHSARDCLEIFMSIVPIKFIELIETNTRMGAVFYNDCLYAAHNSTLVTHRYRKELIKIDPALFNTIGFVDFIPRFRQIGDECLLHHVSEQRERLLELSKRINIDTEGGSKSDNIQFEVRPGGLLQGGLQLAGKLRGKIAPLAKGAENYGATSNTQDGLPLTTSMDSLSKETQISNDKEGAALIVKHLERLSGQWMGVLQESVYLRMMGFLFEAVLQTVMIPILKADCISEAAATDIQRVFKELSKAKNLFPSQLDSLADNVVSNGSDSTTLTRTIPSWKKFSALTDLLEFNLSDVAEWLPRKKFSSFTGQEMMSLIKALFEDTPRRDTVLNSILEMSS